MKERFIRTIKETDAYRIDLVELESWGERKPMHRLILKINDEEVFVRRYDELDVKYDLPDHIRRIDPSKGYFCLYGKGHPLDEFSDPLEEFTHISKHTNNVYSFVGNHKEYSGAFYYLVWDKELINKIKASLNER